MMNNNSTNEKNGFVSIPTVIMPNGKIRKRDMKLPSLVSSDRFALTEIAQEILRRHPQPTFTSLLEWVTAWELAITLQRDLAFIISNKEIEIIQIIYEIAPQNESDLLIFKQIADSTLPLKIKQTAEIQFDKYR